ncbi:MAG TPA: AAA family ATPase, partial [Pyrinomonadaceae bacterium]|nr:AAA family ATPase [Pyrinomonadaceae bacterium]
ELDACVARVKDAALYQRFVAVIGDIGSGKTLLKHRVAAELASDDTITTHLIYPEFPEGEQIQVHQIASYLLTRLGQTVPRDKLERVQTLKQLLEEMYYEDTRVALVFDEGHHLNDRVLTSLKNFWELTRGITSRPGRNRSMTNRLLGIILYCQPQFVTTQMRNVQFREIRQRLQMIAMPPLVKKVKGKPADITKARQYVEHRIRLAGGDPARIFEPETLDTICRNASTPLTLGNLVNESLREAFDKQEKTVQIGFRFFKNLRETPAVLDIREAA